MHVCMGWASWEVSRLLVFGRQRRCFLRMGPHLHVPTHSALSPFASCLRWARVLFRSSSLARSTNIWASSAAGALAPFRKSHVSLPTSAVNTQSLVHTSGDAALPFLNGFAQRVLLSKKGIIKNASLMMVYPTFATILSWVTTTGPSLIVFPLSSKVALSRFCSHPIVSLDSSVSTRRTCLLLDTRRSDRHFTGDSFSRVEVLVANPDGSEAPALYIASGDVQNAFHHMGIPESLPTLSARAFGMTSKNVQGVCVCLRGAKNCFLRHSRCRWVFLERVLLSTCRPSAGELCESSVEFASYR